MTDEERTFAPNTAASAGTSAQETHVEPARLWRTYLHRTGLRPVEFGLDAPDIRLPTDGGSGIRSLVLAPSRGRSAREGADSNREPVPGDVLAHQLGRRTIVRIDHRE